MSGTTEFKATLTRYLKARIPFISIRSAERSRVLELLAPFGFVEDVKGNEAARFGNGGLITQADSAKAFVIPTNEELVIAQGAARFA